MIHYDHRSRTYVNDEHPCLCGVYDGSEPTCRYHYAGTVTKDKRQHGVYYKRPLAIVAEARSNVVQFPRGAVRK
jgi:hypothetical protein